jgi:hypothetical protein
MRREFKNLHIATVTNVSVRATACSINTLAMGTTNPVTTVYFTADAAIIFLAYASAVPGADPLRRLTSFLARKWDAAIRSLCENRDSGKIK